MREPADLVDLLLNFQALEVVELRLVALQLCVEVEFRSLFVNAET